MIHQYKLGNLCVVLDVGSGSVHAVDEVAYAMIAGFETQERETLVDYALVQLKRRRDHRRLAKSELRDNKYVRLEPPQFTIQADGKQSFVCRPVENLAPGEYVLVWLCQTLKDEKAGYRVFPLSNP